jgi:hypothetical protein
MVIITMKVYDGLKNHNKIYNLQVYFIVYNKNRPWLLGTWFILRSYLEGYFINLVG